MNFKMLFIKILFSVLILTNNVLAKALPPGSGIGDIPANVLILLDKSGSMGARMTSGAGVYYPESVAFLSFQVLEGARDGKSVSQLMSEGTTWLCKKQVMDGIPEMIHEVQIEAVFPDGTKLVTIHNPIN